MSCGAEIEANRLFEILSIGLPTITVPDFNGPEWNIPGDNSNEQYQPVTAIDIKDLTEATVGGNGAFDQLMLSVSNHLDAEFKKQRITGAEYTKAYIALTEAAMANATTFLIQKNGAFWQAVLAQAQAITARVGLAQAKVDAQRVVIEAMTAKGNYALAKLKLSTESIGYCTANFTLNEILPLQKVLVAEQGEVQRASTKNTRSDNTPVEGLVGKQRDLYAQQITSYQRDAEVKAAKMFSDVWITQKTIDDATPAPPVFANTSLDGIFTTIKTNNKLGT